MVVTHWTEHELDFDSILKTKVEFMLAPFSLILTP